MEGCDLCQRMKNRIEEVAGKLKLSEVLEMSRSQKVDLVSFYFLSHFSFSLDLFSFILFLELRVRVSDDITWSHISHIR